MSWFGTELAIPLALKKAGLALSSLVPPNFWEVKAAHWLTIGLVLLGFYGGYSKLTNSVESIARAQVELAARMDAIDQRGTTGSRLGITADNLAIQSNTKRIEVLESAVKEFNTRSIATDTKLDVIKALLEGQKQKK